MAADARRDSDAGEWLKKLKSNEPNKKYVKMVAPMVRYSKLPFRMLCREYGADVCYTPMIIAESFNRSQSARDSSFSTNSLDTPLVAQFATNDPVEFAQAAVKVHDVVDAVDLNCGCPQYWALEEHIGGHLSSEPQLVSDMVKEARKHTKVPVTIKIRIQEDVGATVDLVQRAERMGVEWVSVHGRTVPQKGKGDVNYDAIKTIKDSCSIPVVANGNMMCPQDLDEVVQRTGVDGVMCAQGILRNPGMYDGHETCPPEVITRYVDLALEMGGQSQCHKHHVGQMLGSMGVSRVDRKEFNSLRSMAGLVDYCRSRGLWA